MTFPFYATDFTNDDLNRLIQSQYPGSAVSGFSVVEGRQYGDGDASTAGRCVFTVTYAPGSAAELPERLVVKVARIGASPEHGVLYRNELDFYRHLRPLVDLESPDAFGTYYDAESGTFGLAMNDLTQRGAVFMNNQTHHTKENARAILDVFAKLHARFWQSPLFNDELSWMQSHNAGPLHEMNLDNDRVPAYIAWVTSKWKFKQEMLQDIGASLSDLQHQMALVQDYRATLPQTVLHGDGHVGNTYRIGDRGGLLDWQLAIRGHFTHDVGYYIQTSLTLGDRRAWERELIEYYLGKLREEGVATPPTFDEAWFAYRLTCPWNIYIGWLIADVDNYGWEICELAHLRVTAAYRDLESAKAVKEIKLRT